MALAQICASPLSPCMRFAMQVTQIQQLDLYCPYHLQYCCRIVCHPTDPFEVQKTKRGREKQSICVVVSRQAWIRLPMSLVAPIFLVSEV